MSTVTENSEPVNVVDPQSNNDLVNVEQEQKHEPVNVEPKQIPEPILAQLEPEHELDNEEAEPQKQPDNVEQEPEKDTVIMEPEPNNDPVNVEPKPQSDTVNMEPEKDNVNMEPEPKNDPVNVELKPQSDTTIMEPEKDTVNMEPEPKNDPVNVELKPQSDTAIMEPEKDTINMEPEPKNDPVNVEPNRQSDTVNVELEDQNESVVVKSEHQNNPDKIESGTHNEPVNLEAVPESEPLDMELDAQTEPVVNVEPDTKNELVNFEPEPEPAKELVNAEPESDDPPVNTEPDPDDHQDQLVDTETQPIDELTETRPNNELIGADTQPNDELVSADTQPVDELVGAETQQNNEVFNAEMQPNNALIYEEMQLKSEDADHEKQPKNELVVAETQSNNNMIVEETHLNNSMIVEEIHPDNQLVHAETHNPSNMFVHAETHHPNHHELVNAENLQRYNELVNADMQHYEFVDAATSHPNNQLVSMETQPYTNTPNIQISPNNELAIIEKRANDEVENVQTQPNKRRKKKSIVWEHFTIEHVGAGCRRACCKQCKQSFAYSTGSKVAGTSHLKRHIAKGTCPVVLRNQEKNQLLTPNSAPSKINNSSAATSGNNIDTPKRRYRTAAAPYFAFDPDRCRLEIARMIIMHDYPLHIVEHPGFIAFVQNLQPRFDMVSFNTVQGDCVATYLREKQSIQRVIEGMPGRICLTLDLWTSCQTVGYVFLTGHFIDNDWKMHRKILNVVMEPYPDSDSSFSHAVAACLSDWSIEGRLFSITINQPLGETGVDNLRALLSVKNPLILGGQLLIGSCLARALSSIAQDALRAGYDTVKKVRDSVKYVKMSDSHEEKFLELKKHLQVPSTKTLALDDQSQWSSTYEMLLAASELKEVFSCLDTSDPDYKGAPSMEDWKLVETLCTYLKLLFDTASLLIATTVPTTNTFFHEAWKIQLELARAAASEDPIIRNLTHPMQENFDRYWKNSCLILAIAVVMDPRFKMKLVEFSFTKIYGEDAAAYIKTVDEGIHELFLEYVAHPLPLTPTYMEEVNGGFMRTEDSPGFLGSNGLGLTDFDVYIMETTSQQSKTELDQYLEESLLPRVHEFDVVGWWKLNKVKYPTLSKMARDILSIPVSTVGPESVFDTTSKEMDSYRCSLRPETVEAVICAKDWLNSELVESSNGLVKIEFPI